MTKPSVVVLAGLLGLGSCLVACEGAKPASTAVAPPAEAPALEAAEPTPAPVQPEEPKGPPPANPVPFWERGKQVRVIDGDDPRSAQALLLDLGEDWTPYLFTDGESRDAKVLANSYRPTYLALARGEFPDDHQGERAKDDKYLELYGILPTLHLVRERMRATAKLACADEIDLAPVLEFTGLVTYESNPAAKKRHDEFVSAKTRTLALMQQAHVARPEELDLESLSNRDKDAVKRYVKQLPEWVVVDAVQQRLKCEGYFKTRGKYLRGVMDWATHDALAEFERRHRVFSWGYIGKDSMVPLRMKPLQTEREALLRVLLERAIHAAGILEDGSTSTLPNGSPRTYRGKDGREHPIPDLVSQLRETLIDAFGLQTPEGALGWLESLGELPKGERRIVAIRAPKLPEYYSGSMELTLDYDRGDVWYDFPFGPKGEELPQPVQRRPQVTVSVLYEGQKIPLARFGTTIGGWRNEHIDGETMWKYKNSPVGPRAWGDIVAAPVWLPPDSTPPGELLKKNRKKQDKNDPDYVVNYHETGPSYASAYGLVAAYHREFFRKADGSFILGRDEGIRTHGSVDYMSIMRRHSHGCHRMHNHIALRLMSFVLAHRPHQRVGQMPVAFKKQLLYKDKTYEMDIKQGGYAFRLETPLIVNVEEGRIRGQVLSPIEIAIPKYNPDFGLYLMPDGTPVRIKGSTLVPIPLPATLPDGRPLDPKAIPRKQQPAGSAADADAGMPLHTATMPPSSLPKERAATPVAPAPVSPSAGKPATGASEAGAPPLPPSARPVLQAPPPEPSR